MKFRYVWEPDYSNVARITYPAWLSVYDKGHETCVPKMDLIFINDMRERERERERERARERVYVLER